MIHPFVFSRSCCPAILLPANGFPGLLPIVSRVARIVSQAGGPGSRAPVREEPHIDRALLKIGLFLLGVAWKRSPHAVVSASIAFNHFNRL
jgi:hypothetical protein